MKILKLITWLFAIVFAATIAQSARAYEEGSVAGGGTIEGKVVFRGPVQT